MKTISKKSLSAPPRRYKPAFEVRFYPFSYAHDSLLFNGETYAIVPLKGQMWTGYGGQSMTRLGCEVLQWFRTNRPSDAVLHEIIGSSGPNSIAHRFYFKNAEEAEAFRKAVPKIEKIKNEQLFPSFEDLKIGESAKAGGVMKFDLGSPFAERNIALWLWANDNAVGKIYRVEKYVVFEKEDDLVLFKLTFCGKDAIEVTYDGITNRKTKRSR